MCPPALRIGRRGFASDRSVGTDTVAGHAYRTTRVAAVVTALPGAARRRRSRTAFRLRSPLRSAAVPRSAAAGGIGAGGGVATGSVGGVSSTDSSAHASTDSSTASSVRRDRLRRRPRQRRFCRRPASSSTASSSSPLVIGCRLFVVDAPALVDGLVFQRWRIGKRIVGTVDETADARRRAESQARRARRQRRAIRHPAHRATASRASPVAQSGERRRRRCGCGHRRRERFRCGGYRRCRSGERGPGPGYRCRRRARSTPRARCPPPRPPGHCWRRRHRRPGRDRPAPRKAERVHPSTTLVASSKAAETAAIAFCIAVNQSDRMSLSTNGFTC